MLGALNVEQDVAELKEGGLVERLGEDVRHLRLRRDEDGLRDVVEVLPTTVQSRCGIKKPQH